MDLISQVRLFVGDSYKATINDVLDPTPDGVNTIFQLSAFPFASTPVNPVLVCLNTNPITVTTVNSASWSVLDAENGVIQLSVAPSSSNSYVGMAYYRWSFFSDTTVLNSLTAQASDVRYAAIDILNNILADPQGTFFKTYQTGDDTVNDGQFGVMRVQNLRDELLRQTRLPENAGSGFFNFRGLDAIYQNPLSNATFIQDNDNYTFGWGENLAIGNGN